MPRTYKICGSEQQVASTQRTTTAIEITNHRRLLPGLGRERGVGELEAASDEVVRVELKNGFVLWTRTDDLIRERGRKIVGRDGGESWEIDLRPSSSSGQTSTRGWLGLSIKVLEFFNIQVHEKVAANLGKTLEDKLLHDHTSGLYHCSLDDAFSLTAVPENEVLPANREAILVFIHGIASSCQGQTS